MNPRPEENIITAFIEAVQLYGQRQALIFNDDTVTYQQLSDQVKATAYHLKKKGLQKGDKVLLFIPVGIDLYRNVLALFYIGAVPVFLDEWVSVKRLTQSCAIARPQALVAPQKLLALGFFIGAIRKIRIKIKASLPKEKGTDMSPAAVQPDDRALITFTTGSTGLPKAAIRTHTILKAQMQALSPLLHAHYANSLTLLPIVVLLNLGLGKTTVISRISPKNYKPGDARTLARLIDLHHIETVVASPFIITQLSRFSIAYKRKSDPVKEIITGGGPVFPADAALIAEAFPYATATIVYGSTEAEPISHIYCRDIKDITDISTKGLPVGCIDKAAQIRILPWQSSAWPALAPEELVRQQLPANGIGEIIVSGKHVVKHYLQNTEAERLNKIYVNDEVWHRTGDCGRLDQEGRLFLYGRCNAVIATAKELLYPFLMEYMATRTPGVEDAALIAVAEMPVLVIRADQAVADSMTTSPAYDGIKIICVASIPKDVRHRTKNDYEQLKLKIKKLL